MQLICRLQMGTHVLFVFSPVAGGDAKHFSLQTQPKRYRWASSKSFRHPCVGTRRMIQGASSFYLWQRLRQSFNRTQVVVRKANECLQTGGSHTHCIFFTFCTCRCNCCFNFCFLFSSVCQTEKSISQKLIQSCLVSIHLCQNICHALLTISGFSFRPASLSKAPSIAIRLSDEVELASLCT